MATSFGVTQFMQHTPTIVKRLRDAIIYLVAGSLAFVTILAPKFGVTPADFAQWSAFIILGVKTVSMMFGVSDDEALAQLQDKVNSKNNTQGDH